MLSRREMLAGGLAAGSFTSSSDEPGMQSSDDAYHSRILEELRGIRKAVSVENATALAQIRAARRTFFKNSARFPEFVDVGFDVFEAVVDWLVAVQQPVNMSRLADGRYAVPLFATTVVLRSDFPDNYVGQGYDK